MAATISLLLFLTWRCQMRQMSASGSLAAFFVAVFLFAPTPAPAQDLVVGVNAVNPMPASVANQSALLVQFKGAGVHVICCAISNDGKGIDFAEHAAAHGIRVQLGIGPEFALERPRGPTNRTYARPCGAGIRSPTLALHSRKQPFRSSSTLESRTPTRKRICLALQPPRRFRALAGWTISSTLTSLTPTQLRTSRALRPPGARRARSASIWPRAGLPVRPRANSA